MKSSIFNVLLLGLTFNSVFAFNNAKINYSKIIEDSTEPKTLNFKIKNYKWSENDELLYEEFVATLGKARERKECKTTDQCLKSKTANPFYYRRHPSGLRRIDADCADLPYVLRAYFAWMNDLPLLYPSSYSYRNYAKDKARELRYASDGIKINRMTSIKNGDNINDVLRSIRNTINSGAFRITPEVSKENGTFVPYYSAKISRKAIKPGTIVYDPNGHVAVVYDVTSDGRVKMIDAHPDNSLTAITYGEAFVRSRPSAGAGFKNFRPFVLQSPSYDPVSGVITSYSNIYAYNNDEIAEFSLEQYYGTNPDEDGRWSKGTFIFNDKVLNYYEYLRFALSTGNMKIDPIAEFTYSLEKLCTDLEDRFDSVQKAISVGTHRKSHPYRLPDNIYGTSGEWEDYSTPSRDARFKASVREAKNNIEKYLNLNKAKDKMISYTGRDLRSDLIRIYNKEAYACKIEVPLTNKVKRTITLHEAIKNIYKISFDPYHCIELRWGLSGSDLNSCPDNSEKMDWYRAEQNLRQAIERDYDLKMDKTLNELLRDPLGVEVAEDINIYNFLYNYR